MDENPAQTYPNTRQLKAEALNWAEIRERAVADYVSKQNRKATAGILDWEALCAEQGFFW